AAVGTELAAHAAEPRWTGRPVQTVYLGGGTPSLFPPEAIAALLVAATRSFGLVEGAEVTLEANPGTVSRDRLRGYRDAGVNRLSLGAQSFHSAHLATLGRDHGADETARAVEAARAPTRSPPRRPPGTGGPTNASPGATSRRSRTTERPSQARSGSRRHRRGASSCLPGSARSPASMRIDSRVASAPASRRRSPR